MSPLFAKLGTLGILAVAGTASAFVSPVAQRAATVRFTNQLSGSRSVSLSANKHELFKDVAPGTRTDPLTLTDSSAVFELRWTGSDSVIATTQYRFAAGSSYIVSASRGMTEQPTLSVIRDQAPKIKQ